MFKKVKKIIVWFALASTLWMMLFGFSQFNMTMNIDGGTAKCPFSSHTMSICDINPTEHIQEWQSMFTMISIKDTISFFSALLALLALLVFGAWGKFFIHNQYSKIHINPFYLRNYQIFNPLQEAFSKGILNPKIF